MCFLCASGISKSRTAIVTMIDIAKTGHAESEDDSGMETGEILKIAIRLLDIRKAHKKHINEAQLYSLISQKLVMPKSEGDSR